METNEQIPSMHSRTSCLKHATGIFNVRSTALPVSFSTNALRANFVDLCRSYLPKISPETESSLFTEVQEPSTGLDAEPEGKSHICIAQASSVPPCLQWSQKIGMLFSPNSLPAVHMNSSIRDGSFKPRVIFNNGGIWLLGRRKDGELLRRVSDLGLRDRMFGSEHPIDQDADSLAIVKAFSKAVDRKLFSLCGEFSCANAYLASNATETPKYKRKKPMIEADVLVPYFWVRDSQICGRLVYNAAPAGDGTRVIRVIDVRRDGDLRNVVPHRAVVYLGGQHAEYVTQVHGEIGCKTSAVV